MNLISFLSDIKNYIAYHNNSVIVFQGSDYPCVFFSYLIAYIKKQNGFFEVIDNTQDISSLRARFETSFLGTSGIYWLGNAAELDAKNKKHLYAYLEQYQGPHLLMLYSPSADKLPSSSCLVTIDKQVGLALIEQLVILFDENRTDEYAPFFKTVLTNISSLSLDRACLLLSYKHLIGKETKEFFREWMQPLAGQDSSLFTLSQHFFARDKQAFFSHWLSIARDYSEQFWLAFWSEQLWRAYYLVIWSEQKKLTQAKKIAFRLPFSFIRSDWKRYTADELKKAHQFLYSLDYHIKNGIDVSYFELFYSKFLNQEFANTH